MKVGTVSINKQSGHRIQAIMTDKDTTTSTSDWWSYSFSYPVAE